MNLVYIFQDGFHRTFKLLAGVLKTVIFEQRRPRRFRLFWRPTERFDRISKVNTRTLIIESRAWKKQEKRETKEFFKQEFKFLPKMMEESFAFIFVLLPCCGYLEDAMLASRGFWQLFLSTCWGNIICKGEVESVVFSVK